MPTLQPKSKGLATISNCQALLQLALLQLASSHPCDQRLAVGL